MRRLLQLLPFVLLAALLVVVVPGSAQQSACPALVKRALTGVAQGCGDLGRNSVCYGNTLIEASFTSAGEVAFSQPSDRVNIDLLRSLHTFPLDETRGLWGVAVMNLQANLPNTLPGQGVKFVLFGDVALENRSATDSPRDYGPMQAFYFTTGAGSLRCNELPPSSLVIQSPKGYNVRLNANGLDIVVGSTVALTATRNQSMKIATLEGRAVTMQAAQRRVIPAGFQATVRLGGEDGLTPVDEVSEPELLDSDEWQAVVDSSSLVFEEAVDSLDLAGDYEGWDDFCADPANADLCEVPDDLCDDDWCDAYCGDLVCEGDEDAEFCPVDCGADDAAFCDDGACYDNSNDHGGDDNAYEADVADDAGDDADD